MQLYELKEIHSEEDLPKENGLYVSLSNLMVWDSRWFNPDKDKKSWTRYIRSYLSPVTVEKETVYVPTHPQNWSDKDVVCQTDGTWVKKSEVLIVKQ